MKTTASLLLLLAALSSPAISAATLADAQYTLTAPGTVAIDDFSNYTYSIVTVFDLQSLQSKIAAGLPLAHYSILDFTNTRGTTDSVSSLSTDYRSTADNTIEHGAVALRYNNSPYAGAYLNSVDFNDYTFGTITFTSNNNSGTTLYVSLYSDTSSDPTVITATSDAFKFTNNNLTSVTLTDTGIGTSAYIFDTVLTQDEVTSISRELIPEPTAASLGLLGLCGLMMRRRRA